jgi:hypothetical protein
MASYKILEEVIQKQIVRLRLKKKPVHGRAASSKSALLGISTTILPAVTLPAR